MEFAFAMVFLPLLAFGVTDFGRAYQLQTKLRNAAREGASFAQFFPASTTAPCAGSTGYIVEKATGADSTAGVTPGDVEVLKGSTVELTPCTTAFNPGDTVTVEVTGSFTPLTPFLGGTIVIKGRQTVTVQR